MLFPLLIMSLAETVALLQTLLHRQRVAQPLSRDAAKIIIHKYCPLVFQTGMSYLVRVNLTANITVTILT